MSLDQLGVGPLSWVKRGVFGKFVELAVTTQVEDAYYLNETKEEALLENRTGSHFWNIENPRH